MRKTLIVITSALGTYVLFLAAISLQNTFLQGSFESEYTPLEADYIANATFERCSINILKPKFAKLTEYKDENEINITFYSPIKILSQTEANWDTSYTGGTTIKNTTFDELVVMVKEDCSQFQKGDRKGEMEWIYSPAPTQEEIDRDKINKLEKGFYGFGEEAKQLFIDTYGDLDIMTKKEKIDLADRIEEEGLDSSIDKAREAGLVLEDLRFATDSQREAIRARYGDWKNLSTEELIEWANIIKKDIDASEFNPENY